MMEILDYARAEDTIKIEMGRQHDNTTIEAANVKLKEAQEALMVPLSEDEADKLHAAELNSFFRGELSALGYIEVKEEKVDG